MSKDFEALATAYSVAANAASLAAVDAEAEAQLTVPVSNLFSGLVEDGGLVAFNSFAKLVSTAHGPTSLRSTSKGRIDTKRVLSN